MKTPDQFWNEFIKNTGRDEDDLCSGDLTFESEGITNDSQIALILTGKKTAFFSSFDSYIIDGEPLPVEDEFYMVFDRAENPVCIIQIENVSVLQFNEITWEMARRDGEDNNLEEWKEKHQQFLEEEGQIVGFEFSPEMKIIFQLFRVVYRNEN